MGIGALQVVDGLGFNLCFHGQILFCLTDFVWDQNEKQQRFEFDFAQILIYFFCNGPFLI